ncbi:TPA: hypothetical protein ACLAX2_000206 [Neisseria meningitidis]|nr:hypothetical protein [Neisseria meningitidis]CWN24221.1 Uncharacterised protein [Neisseria meningitidis]CWO92384.1 Uncharacterised protein [Neisseria meningitidis]CWP29803.1 Uncharacterised protein [Neisseria meningitidis]CWP79084.1 Uncharacterised protein [Neisseria meningitidis]CWR14902.1 Uncharacterised protein [Neisseria meningitidis]
MFFQIACNSENSYISLLKSMRFYIDNKECDYIFFRKAVNISDDFIQSGFITPEGLITKNSNPKLFNQYSKMVSKNKCQYEMVTFLSDEMKNIIELLSNDDAYIEFAYSEDFYVLPEIEIDKRTLKSLNFYIDFGVKYIINKI